ncbi:MAG: hypothetical protein AUK54_05030 [Helicobacteraceae bacterium CG2_30_36_10]|nr:MAG: hypothetical protein AUK54_05030 [Helicobacteraceae bacterium CG2_30_36_10]
MYEIIIIVMFVALLVALFFIYKNLQEAKYNKDILDSVPDIILIYKNSKLVEVNKSFFNYFDKYSSLAEFIKANDSISYFFEQEEGYLNPLALDGSSWFEYVKQIKVARVKIRIEKKEYYFSINFSILENNINCLLFSDITQLVKSQKEINNLIFFDPETHIGNRRYCDEKIKQEVAVAQRYKHDLSIVMLEIDKFKELEDLHGEIVAHKLQIAYVKLILSLLREIDIYCRFSENKFIIILPSTNLAGARQVAQKLKDAVSLSQKVLHVTMSFGVTAYLPGTEITSFLTKADKALQSAQESGTNRIVIL